jgi:hypothetical protein
MASHSTIGVDNDLPASQPSISQRTTNFEPAARVDPELRVAVDQFGRNDTLDDQLGNVTLYFIVGGFWQMLGRDNNRIYPDRLAIGVFHRDLALAVWQQVADLARLASLSQSAGNLVGQGNGQWKQLFGFVAGIPNHHPLIASTGFVEDVTTRFTPGFQSSGLRPLRFPGSVP